MTGFEDEANQLLTAAEVAEILKVTVRTVMNYKGKNIIPYYQVGRVLRFRLSDILEHIEENTITLNAGRHER